MEFGRIDIYAKVTAMSQYSASPRLGHIECFYHVFAYLKNHNMLRIVFDPKTPDIEESSFASGSTGWKYFYKNVEEELPPDMHGALGKSTHITYFVDANHTGNVVTRRSHIGFLI